MLPYDPHIVHDAVSSNQQSINQIVLFKSVYKLKIKLTICLCPLEIFSWKTFSNTAYCGTYTSELKYRVNNII